MANSIPELDAAVLERHKIDVVIISNGHWQIIKKYRGTSPCCGSNASSLFADCASRPVQKSSTAPSRFTSTARGASTITSA